MLIRYFSTKINVIQIKNWHYVLLVGLLSVAALLAFFNLGQKPLWDYDEATYAEVTREMLCFFY